MNRLSEAERHDERPYTLGEILEAHRVERLGFPGAVKCHACDDWKAGTIHDHHADLALAFYDVPALTSRLASVEALADEPIAPYPADCGCSHGMGFQFHRFPCRYAGDIPKSALRAVLGSDAHTEQKGTCE